MSDLLKKLVLDVHTHTLASGHAYGTIRENVEAAKERGMLLYGHSEHGPGVPGTCEPIYFSCFPRLPRFISGMEVVCGAELNVNNGGGFDFPENLFKCLDYALVGIHFYKDEGREANTDNVISCMKHEKVFFVSHPDSDFTPLNYERLVQAAKENHVALELNNSSFRKQSSRLNCVENYRTMLRLCREYGTYILVSTDAHDPSEVGDFTEAAEFLEEQEFPEELILNTSVEKFKEFIHYRQEKDYGMKK